MSTMAATSRPRRPRRQFTDKSRRVQFGGTVEGVRVGRASDLRATGAAASGRRRRHEGVPGASRLGAACRARLDRTCDDTLTMCTENGTEPAKLWTVRRRLSGTQTPWESVCALSTPLPSSGVALERLLA